MKQRGIEYYNEYSDARYVYRFKVSKKARKLRKDLQVIKKTTMKKVKVLNPFQYVLKEENGVPQKGCTLIPMQGFARFEDFYLCVPEEGFYCRAGNNMRYGINRNEYFIDGSFVGAGCAYKKENARKLYDAGYVSEAVQYIRGYMLWRETTLGGKHINERKEAARISHALCDAPGKVGHDARQYIRKQILRQA